MTQYDTGERQCFSPKMRNKAMILFTSVQYTEDPVHYNEASKEALRCTY